MQRRKTLGAAALAAFVSMLSVEQAVPAETLRVSAAASLTDAFREVAAIYEQRHPGDRVELNFAGSQILRTQIEQGAPADVFASADLLHVDALRSAGLLGSYGIFARNRIVLVVPSGDAKVGRLEDLGKPGIKIVVAGAAVPVGHYTSDVLAKLDAAGRYGDDFRARAQANVISQETNVRAVLSKVALGEADAGFVYATDAITSSKVRTIDIPDRDNVVAAYPIGILTSAVAPEKAKAFIDLVLGDEGQSILRKYGFAQRP